MEVWLPLLQLFLIVAGFGLAVSGFIGGSGDE